MDLQEGRDWQRFLSTAIENANDAVILYEAATHRDPLVIAYVNRMFEEQTGYSREEAIGKTRELLFGPLTNATTAAELRAAVRSGVPGFGELLKYRKDGSTFWVELTIRPLLDTDGTLTGAVAIQRDITQRKQIEAQHDRMRELFDAIMAHTKNLVFVKDLEGRYIYVNREFERLAGRDASTILGQTDFDIVSPDLAERIRDKDRQALEAMAPVSQEERVPTVDGETTFLVVNFPLVDGDGRAYATCGIGTNIDDRAQTLQRLQLVELALDRARDAIAIYRLHSDGTWRIHYANQAMSTMTGYAHDQLIAQTSDIIIGPRTDKDEIIKSREALKSGTEVHAEWLCYRKDGTTFWAELNATPLTMRGSREPFTIVVYRDITKKKEQQEQLSFDASHDPLTGAFNRRYFERMVQQAVADAGTRKTEHGLILLDLDGFKAINDTYGHEAGDKLLIALTMVMSSRLRRGDVLARLGGDEFAIILLGCSAEQSERLGTELIDAIAAYAYPFGDHPLRVSASAGVTIIDATTTEFREVLRTADEACYAAKRAGKNRVVLATR